MPTKETNRALTTWRRDRRWLDSTCSGVYSEPPILDLPTVTYAWVDSRDGVDNKNWREDIRKRRNAATPMTAVRQTYSTKYWKCLWQADWRSTCGPAYAGWKKWRTLDGTYVNFTTSLNSAPLSDDTDNAALTKVYKKLADAETKLQGLVFIGELAETLRMIKRPAAGLREGVDRYLIDAERRVKRSMRRRGRPVRADQHAVTRASKAVADSWLEHVFGWSPFISDIESGFEALQRIKERNLFPMEVVVAQSDCAAPTQVEVGRSLPGGTSPAYADWSKDKIVSTRYKVAYALEPRSLGGSTLDSFGLRARQFVPSLWELIPYSFLIDYFTNIGDVVQSWSVNRTRILWIVKTRVTTYRNQIISAYQGDWFSGAQEKRFISRPSATWTRRTVVRSVPASLNYPHLEVEIPGLGSRKWLNIAALIRSGRSTESAVRRSLRL